MRFVGRGGMGEVWEAHDRVIERSVAIKLLPYQRANSAGIELFFREARTAGALHHPGVVTVHDLGEDAAEGSLFLVMELLDGRDLGKLLLHEGVPPVEVAVEWGAQTAAALAAAHDAGVVHRDLKPANLMLTVDGRLVILDFGIARFVETSHKSSRVMGTLAYMPPERFQEQPGDARSDLYSLGCVLNELLTGQVPFQASGPVAMMNAHLGKAPARPGESRRGVPPALDDLVLALLAKDPRDRPATALEVQHRLQSLAAPGPPRTEPDRRSDTVTLGERSGKQDTSRRRFIQLGSAAVATVGAGIGIATVVSRLQGRWPFHASGVVYGTPVVADGVVYVGDGAGSLYALDAISCDRKWVSHISDGFMAGPALAGGRLYAASTDGRLYVVDAATGTTQWTYSTGGAIFDSTPAVVNGVVYVGSRDQRLHAVDAASGAKKWTYFINGSHDPTCPAVANDVVFITGGSPGTGVHAISAASGARKWVNHVDEQQQIEASPAVADGVVYVGDREGRFLAIDAASGVKKWDIPTGDDVLFCSAAVIDGAAYAYGSNGNLYAINVVTGAMKWTASVGYSIASSFTPAVVGGLVFGGGGSKFYAIDATTGIKKWTFSGSDKARFSSPAVAKGVVYVGGGGDGNLYALDVDTGKELT
ncbi:PQQ-binding-like beta-propeller repeat protein [Streptomyces sp. NBC_00536]|uniref:serine/threonine-protein kinase n=1 Tax=Streptomyces sp. NBC_00536 TaxID=2975769 RepID=UPI002E81BD06|nr:PQQ-binding-like beta-propeller repeat protein [Streptomyces sp. NBC_00536]WUC84052.1 PQQ-binding-like beta-propeller repeat protein [Streptomyces sp. NBC_00536]